MEQWEDISARLGSRCIVASAPTRLDCGGSTDHVLTALLCKVYHPATTNLALDLRTRVALQAYHPQKIMIEFAGEDCCEIIPPKIFFSGPYGLICAILAHFGISGVRLSINAEAPRYSGLGGSGALCVALIGAIQKALALAADEPAPISEIPLLAHHIEDALYGNTGLQDQLAAAYGNMHLWEWNYGSQLAYTAHALRCAPSVLEKHMLLAYTGEPHPTSQKGSVFLHTFRAYKTNHPIERIAQISELARRFAGCIEAGDYRAAGQALSDEMRIRAGFIPGLVHETGRRLIDHAARMGCGAKITGHGGGGCIWAVGPESAIADLRQAWQTELANRQDAYFLPVVIAPAGLEVTTVEKP